MRTFLISLDLIVRIDRYLATRPSGEVHDLVLALHALEEAVPPATTTATEPPA